MYEWDLSDSVGVRFGIRFKGVRDYDKAVRHDICITFTSYYFMKECWIQILTFLIVNQ